MHGYKWPINSPRTRTDTVCWEEKLPDRSNTGTASLLRYINQSVSQSTVLRSSTYGVYYLDQWEFRRQSELKLHDDEEDDDDEDEDEDEDDDKS